MNFVFMRLPMTLSRLFLQEAEDVNVVQLSDEDDEEVVYTVPSFKRSFPLHP